MVKLLKLVNWLVCDKLNQLMNQEPVQWNYRCALGELYMGHHMLMSV